MGLLQSITASEFWQKHIYLNFIAEDRWKYLTDGLQNTILITIGALIIGIVLGAMVSVVRVTHDKAGKPGIGLRLVNLVCKVYLTVIRGTPVVVQLLIMWFVVFASAKSDQKLMVAIIAFGINSGAYVAEIFRSGIESIPVGQKEAATILGFTKIQTFFHISLPQVIKRILPPMGSECMTLVKDTALAQTIGVAEMFRLAQTATTREFSIVPIFVAGIFYLIMNGVVSVCFTHMEKRLSYYD